MGQGEGEAGEEGCLASRPGTGSIAEIRDLPLFVLCTVQPGALRFRKDVQGLSPSANC